MTILTQVSALDFLPPFPCPFDFDLHSKRRIRKDQLKHNEPKEMSST